MPNLIMEFEDIERLGGILCAYKDPDTPPLSRTSWLSQQLDSLLNYVLNNRYTPHRANSEWNEIPYLVHYANKVIDRVLSFLDNYPIDYIVVLDVTDGTVKIEF